MPLGGFAPLPVRLGGSATEGWTAGQHARACADLLALKRTAPLASWTYLADTGTGTVTIENYYGVNGIGSLYVFDTITYVIPGRHDFLWTYPSFEDAYEQRQSFVVRHALATAHNNGNQYVAIVDLRDNGVRVQTCLQTGVAADCRVSVTLW